MTAIRCSRNVVAKPAETRVLMSLRPDGRAISFFGDLHPSFSGNVVKAMGKRQAAGYAGGIAILQPAGAATGGSGQKLQRRNSAQRFMKWPD